MREAARRPRPRWLSPLPWLLLAAALTPPGAVAQVYSFRTFTASDGLPHSFAYAVAQDRRGYLWFGTFGGVARYDGERFETWTLKEGLPGNDVRAVVEDEAGRLWLGTNGGVAVLEPGENGAISPERPPRVYGVKDGLPAPTVLALVPDGSRGMWVVTRDGGVSRIGAVGVETTLLSGKELPSTTAWCAARDPQGAIWVGTRGEGVARIETGAGGGVTRFGTAEGLPDLNVFDLKVSPEGALHAATSRGVARFDERESRFALVRYAPDADASVSSLGFNSSTMWVGRYGRGLAKVTAERSVVYGEEHGLPNGFVTGLFVDREGSLWLTTHGSGVVQFATDRFASFPRDAGWPGGVSNSFAEEGDGTLWMGSFGKGVARLSGGKLQTFGTADGLGDERVRAVLVDRNGTVLVGTSSTLSARPKGAARFSTLLGPDQLAGGFVSGLAEEEDGTLYVGTSSGLLVRRPDGGLTTYRRADGLVADIVESLSLTPGGRLFVGTGQGVSLLVNGRLLSVPPAPWGVPEGRLFRVVADRQGRYWFGGDGGLARLTPGKDLAAALTSRSAWARFGIAEGLPAAAVTAVAVAADGAVWAGTSRGLARFDGERFRQRGGRDELLSPEIINRTGTLDREGRLWWGTPLGPIVYNPGSDRANSTPPAVFVTEVEAGGRRWHGLPHLDLAQAVPSVAFRYAALTYRDPTQVLFRTRLDGFDASWSAQTSARQVRYTNLPPGRYTFQVLAANGDGVWSRTPATMELSVPAPWWRKPWLMALAAILVTGAFFLAYELRVASMRRHALTLERLVGERTEELRALDAKKSEFVSMVSHELRAPLTSIRGALEVISGETLGALPPRAKALVDVAHRSSTRLGRLIDDLLDVERIESGKIAFDVQRHELAPLLATAVDANAAYALQHGISITLEAPVPNATVAVDADRLVQVITNLLSNAVKLSPRGETVRVLAARQGARVRIAVVDRGPGVPEEFKSRIFERFSQAQSGAKKGGSGLGLSIAKGLVEGMGGSIGFTSEAGQGATFFVDLPVEVS